MGQPELNTAREVSEYLLHKTACGLMQRDFESFCEAFVLPQIFTTQEARIVLNNIDEMRTAFHHMCDINQQLGVTELKRVCEVAEFDGPDRVTATHISHIIAEGKALVPPYPVYSKLIRKKGIWRIETADYAIDANHPQAMAMHGIRPVDSTAKAIYQDHVNTTAAALLADDLATFKARTQLPLRITTETDIIVINTEDELKAKFDFFVGHYRNRGLTDLVRVVKEAYFYDDNDIRGIHESNWMCNDRRLITPYPNRLRLLRDADGQWRETHCAHAVLNKSEDFTQWTQIAEHPQLPDLDFDPERTEP